MSNTDRVEVFAGIQRRRRYSLDQKRAVLAEAAQPGMSISYVARRHGISPSLLFGWRREGDAQSLRWLVWGPAQTSVPARRTYRSADVAFLKSSLRADLFQDASYDAILEDLIRRILDQEAPMLDSLLVDRVARLHGFKRSGRLIRERVLELAPSAPVSAPSTDSSALSSSWLKDPFDYP